MNGKQTQCKCTASTRAAYPDTGLQNWKNGPNSEDIKIRKSICELVGTNVMINKISILRASPPKMMRLWYKCRGFIVFRRQNFSL